MDSELAIYFYCVAALLILLLLVKYGRWIGMTSMAEKRAAEEEERAEGARREQAAREAREAKLATMDEPERKRFLAREFLPAQPLDRLLQLTHEHRQLFREHRWPERALRFRWRLFIRRGVRCAYTPRCGRAHRGRSCRPGPFSAVLLSTP